MSYAIIGAVSATAQIEPETLTAQLRPTESVTEAKIVTLPAVIPSADIIFAFDLTLSLADEIAVMKSQAINIMNDLDSLISDARYAVVSYMDYPHTYASCDYEETYGYVDWGDYAYRLDQPMTGNRIAVSNAINALTLGYGGDGPQDYTRIFYESYADPAIGYRLGSKKILINFGDAVPHDCDINEGVPGYTVIWSTGVDPGRDEIAGTGDDLDLQDVLAKMAANDITLLQVQAMIPGLELLMDYWDYWTSLTGGAAFELTDAAQIPEAVQSLVEGEASFVSSLTLQVTTPGYYSWLTSVDPPYYSNVVLPAWRDFEITITVPVDASPGTHVFYIGAIADGVSYGEQQVTIEVKGPEAPQFVTHPWPCGGGTIISVGQSLAIDILAFDSNPTDLCTLKVADIPTGAILSNSLPLVGNPVSTILSWTPETSEIGSYEIEFTAMDTEGFFSTCEFYITVEENLAPELAPIGSKSVDEGQTLSFGISATDPDGTIPALTAENMPANATFTDHRDGTGTFAYNPDYTQAGTYYVTFVASDGSLHDDKVVKITVNEINQPPVLAPIGSKSVTESQILSFGVSAADPDGTIPALTAENLPANATFADNGNGTGTFYFAPDYTQGGTYYVRFIASDGSLTDDDIVTITVAEGSRPPVLAPIGSQSVNEGQNLNFSVSASDPDGDPLSLIAENLPVNATFTDFGGGTGTFDFTPDYGQAGTYHVHFIASDGSLIDDEWVTIMVGEENRSPELDAIGPQSVNEGENLNFSISASDPDGDPLALTAEDLPANATFTDHGDGTGAFDFNPAYTQAGVYYVPFVASDGSLADAEVVVITVNNTNRRPELDLTTSHMVDEGQNLYFDVWGGDPDGDLLTLSAMDIPAHATFTDHGDGFGIFDFNPDYTQAGIYYVAIIASDGSLTDTEVVTITVNDVNLPPVLDPIGLQSVYEGQNLNFDVSASDPDGDPISLTAEDVPANATFTDLDDGTGTFDFNPDFDQAGFYSVTFISSDGTGTDDDEVTIEVINVNRPPEVSVPADTQEVEVDSAYVFLIAADDPDGDPLELSVATPSGPDQNWTFVDSGNGNGSFTFMPDASQEGDYQVLFTASDGEDSDADTLFLRVIPKPLRFTINVTHAESIMIDDEVQVTFNVPIDPQSVNSTTLNVSVDGEIIDCEYRFIDEDRSIIFNPQGPYPPLSVVVVDLSGLEGAGGEDWPPGEPNPATFYTRYGVHPGDLNNDGTIDHLDILQIVAHWRKTDHARFGSGLNWRIWGMKPAMGWTEPEVTYADADGDGTVDQNDLFPIGHHWQNTHEYPIPVTGSGSSFAPEYYQEELRALYDAVKHDQSPFMHTVKVYLEGLLKIDAVPQRFWISQNFPNPFNASTSITFYLPESDHAKLAVINALGRHVRLLERRDFPAGEYTFVWDGRDDNGDCVASGLYFFQLTGRSFTGTLKMTLLK